MKSQLEPFNTRLRVIQSNSSMLGWSVCGATNINNFMSVCVLASLEKIFQIACYLMRGHILATSILASRLMAMGWPVASSLYRCQIISLLSPPGLGRGSALAHQVTEPSSALQTAFSKSLLDLFPPHSHLQGNMVPPVPEIWGFSNVEQTVSWLSQLIATGLNVFYLLSHLPPILVLSSS